MSADDLSGDRRGVFNYPAAQPPTEFTAALHDDGQDGDHGTVAYQGAVDADGAEITGHRTIPGIRSGAFIMVREKGVDAEAEAEEAIAEPEHAPPVVRAPRRSVVGSVRRAGLADPVGPDAPVRPIGKAR